MIPWLQAAAVASTLALAGYVFGRLYFAAVRRTAAALAARRGLTGPVAMTLGRFGLAATLMAGAAKLGAAALLAALVGFLVARTLSLRAAREIP